MHVAYSNHPESDISIPPGMMRLPVARMPFRSWSKNSGASGYKVRTVGQPGGHAELGNRCTSAAVPIVSLGPRPSILLATFAFASNHQSLLNYCSQVLTDHKVSASQQSMSGKKGKRWRCVCSCRTYLLTNALPCRCRLCHSWIEADVDECAR